MYPVWLAEAIFGMSDQKVGKFNIVEWQLLKDRSCVPLLIIQVCNV